MPHHQQVNLGHSTRNLNINIRRLEDMMRRRIPPVNSTERNRIKLEMDGMQEMLGPKLPKSVLKQMKEKKKLSSRVQGA